MLAHFPNAAPHDELLAALDRDGAIVLDGRAAPAQLDLIARELAPWLDRPVDRSPLGNNAFTGMRTLRTSALIAKSAGCRELAQADEVLAIADAVLGPQCARFQLSFTQAIKIGPGEAAQAIHRDSTMYPFRRPGPELFINVIWALTDFRRDNGATRVYLGSHRWADGRLPTAEDPWVAAEMPRGSAIIYYGSVFHGGGANVTDEARIGVAFGYTLGWLRQEENQYLAVPPALAQTFPIPLQRLLGYGDHYPFLGWSEGADPDILHGGHVRKRYATDLIGGASRSLTDILRDGRA